MRARGLLLRTRGSVNLKRIADSIIDAARRTCPARVAGLEIEEVVHFYKLLELGFRSFRAEGREMKLSRFV